MPYPEYQIIWHHRRKEQIRYENAAHCASGATIKYDGESSKTVTIKNKAKTAISVTVSKDGARRTYVLVFDKDIDVDMDEEETVDDAKTEKEAVVGATQMSICCF